MHDVIDMLIFFAACGRRYKEGSDRINQNVVPSGMMDPTQRSILVELLRAHLEICSLNKINTYLTGGALLGLYRC